MKCCPNCGVETNDEESVCSLCGFEFDWNEETSEETVQEENLSNTIDTTEKFLSDEPDDTKPAEPFSKNVTGTVKKRKVIPMVIAVIILLLLIGGGILVYSYFGEVQSKQSMDHSAVRETTATITEDLTESTTMETTTTKETSTETTTESTTTILTTTLTEENGVKSIDDLYGYVFAPEGNVSGYTTAYVVEGGDFESEHAVEDGWHIVAKSTYESYGVTWYQCWDADDGDYYGWIDANYLNFNDTSISNYSDSLIYVDNNNLLHVNFNFYDYNYTTIQTYLGITLEAQQDFPYWGNNLKMAGCTYNGVSLCFMFQDNNLVMIIYDTMSELDMNVVNQAVIEYGTYYDTINDGYAFFPGYGYYFEIAPDYYVDTGEIVYHQRFISETMY